METERLIRHRKKGIVNAFKKTIGAPIAELKNSNEQFCTAKECSCGISINNYLRSTDPLKL